jgi:hypothetical protein
MTKNTLENKNNKIKVLIKENKSISDIAFSYGSLKFYLDYISK